MAGAAVFVPREEEGKAGEAALPSVGIPIEKTGSVGVGRQRSHAEGVCNAGIFVKEGQGTVGGLGTEKGKSLPDAVGGEAGRDVEILAGWSGQRLVKTVGRTGKAAVEGGEGPC